MSNRIKYFFAHLLVSVLVAVICLSTVFFVWYPSPLAKAVGVTNIFLMLVAIDVIVGPLLSLLVYKDGKKTLKMDLICIALVQVLALGYGIFNIAQARPVWIVQDGHLFELVRNNDLSKEGLAHAKPEYQNISWGQPRIAAVKHSESAEENNTNLMKELESGIPASFRPERYTKLNNEKQRLLQHAKSLDGLELYNSGDAVKNILAKYPKADAWLALRTGQVDMTVLIDKESAEVIKIVDLRPWN